MSHKKWRETKQQLIWWPLDLALLGCCLDSPHLLCDILSGRPVSKENVLVSELFGQILHGSVFFQTPCRLSRHWGRYRLHVTSLSRRPCIKRKLFGRILHCTVVCFETLGFLSHISVVIGELRFGPVIFKTVLTKHLSCLWVDFEGIHNGWHDAMLLNGEKERKTRWEMFCN